MSKYPASLLFSLFLLLATGCATTNYADRGALTGALVGSGLGAAIGDKNDEELEGAAVGAIVGAFAGSAIGESIDHEQAIARSQYEHQLAQKNLHRATFEEIIAMNKEGLSEEVIIGHVEQNGLAKRPTSYDLMNLKKQGVNDRILLALQNQSFAPVEPVSPVGPGNQTIVEEYHYYDRRPPRSRWRNNHHDSAHIRFHF
ncbi:MAG: glycine zipper family protein [Pirellulaceae bacterium]|nr:glycine zipper family protein [Pirellulaceae bacterium]